MNMDIDLQSQSCAPCTEGTPPLTNEQIEQGLTKLEGWSFSQGMIMREYSFKNHYQAQAFMNAVAWVSHQQDHHPDLLMGYNTVKVSYVTHSIGGISTNDMVCAAKVNALLEI